MSGFVQKYNLLEEDPNKICLADFGLEDYTEENIFPSIHMREISIIQESIDAFMGVADVLERNKEKGIDALTVKMMHINLSSIGNRVGIESFEISPALECFENDYTREYATSISLEGVWDSIKAFFIALKEKIMELVKHLQSWFGVGYNALEKNKNEVKIISLEKRIEKIEEKQKKRDIDGNDTVMTDIPDKLANEKELKKIIVEFGFIDSKGNDNIFDEKKFISKIKHYETALDYVKAIVDYIHNTNLKEIVNRNKSKIFKEVKDDGSISEIDSNDKLNKVVNDLKDDTFNNILDVLYNKFKNNTYTVESKDNAEKMLEADNINHVTGTNIESFVKIINEPLLASNQVMDIQDNILFSDNLIKNYKTLISLKSKNYLLNVNYALDLSIDEFSLIPELIDFNYIIYNTALDISSINSKRVKLFSIKELKEAHIQLKKFSDNYFENNRKTLTSALNSLGKIGVSLDSYIPQLDEISKLINDKSIIGDEHSKKYIAFIKSIVMNFKNNTNELSKVLYFFIHYGDKVFRSNLAGGFKILEKNVEIYEMAHKANSWSEFYKSYD